MDDCTDKYDDIINLPHHVSQRHPRMPMSARAAQFSSFAALSGYDEAVKDTAHEAEDTQATCENEQAAFWEV